MVAGRQKEGGGGVDEVPLLSYIDTLLPRGRARTPDLEEVNVGCNPLGHGGPFTSVHLPAPPRP